MFVTEHRFLSSWHLSCSAPLDNCRVDTSAAAGTRGAKRGTAELPRLMLQAYKHIVGKHEPVFLYTTHPTKWRHKVSLSLASGVLARKQIVEARESQTAEHQRERKNTVSGLFCRHLENKAGTFLGF